MANISVIVPVYKVESWLDRCVQSILDQTYRDFELLLIDDGSPDRCGEMCDAWAKKDPRIRTFHKPNGGLSDARNFGLDHATGDYISFVDSDDYVLPKYLEYLLSLFNESPDAKYVECSLFEKHGETLSPRDNSGDVLVLGHHEILENLMYDRWLYVSAWGKLFCRSIFANNVRFLKGVHYEDSYIYKNYLESSAELVYGGCPLYVYDIRPDSITTTGFNYKSLKDHFDSYTLLSNYAVERFPDLVKAQTRYLSFSRFRTLRFMKTVPDEYKPLRMQLRLDILKVLPALLGNRKVPLRDKIAALTLLPGLWFYFLAWDLYTLLRTRI